MSAPVLLLSDLHLPDAPSPLRNAFLRFLDGPAREAAAVYILGDLFEAWIGDAEGLRDHAPEAAALRRLTASGVRVSFVHGNRDFLVGAGFARATGITLLPDPVVVDLAGTPTVLAHGDRYCTDDLAYQRWRAFARNRLAQALFRRLPETLRRRVAGAARGRSEHDKPRKPPAIMDVNAQAITAAFAPDGPRRLIHGHTHRPAEHRLALADGTTAERIVLADWRADRFEYLAADARGLHRRTVAAA